MSKKTTPPEPYAILERLFDRAGWVVTPDAARCLQQLSLDENDRARIQELAQKASANTLAWPEQREADFYEFLTLFLDLLHSKARLSLKRTKRGA